MRRAPVRLEAPVSASSHRNADGAGHPAASALAASMAEAGQQDVRHVPRRDGGLRALEPLDPHPAGSPSVAGHHDAAVHRDAGRGGLVAAASDANACTSNPTIILLGDSCKTA